MHYIYILIYYCIYLYSVVFHASVEMETREVGEVGRGPTGTAAWQQLLKTVYHKQALLSGEQNYN